MDNSDIAKEWFAFSKRDLDTAIHLINTMNPKPLEIICYHSQQSAEKVLKGYLILNETMPPRTHDLLLLCDMCSQRDNEFIDIADNCSLITMYGVQPRYPFEIDITDIDAEKATQIAGNIYSFVMQKVIAGSSI